MGDYGDDASEGPRGTYEIYKAEADVLFKQGEYKKALASFNTALELRPGDKNCLIARSQCHLALGDSDSALADAEVTLEEDKNFIKGLFQKAESLYQKGEFEFALMYYHKGKKLRPEVQGFKLGIQKSQEAIDNSIGKDAGLKLENKGDLDYFFKQEELSQFKKEQKPGKAKPKPVAKRDDREKRPRKQRDSKTVKQLLGELYADKEFLEKLLKETENAERQTDTTKDVHRLALQGLDYLDTRTEFWQQQKPMYSRKRDKQIRESARSRAGSSKRDPTTWVLKALEQIDEAQADGRYEDSLKQAKKTLKDLDKWNDEDIPNRAEVVANLHSCMGNAYLEMGDYAKSLDHHQKDLEIAKQNDLDDAKSRALDNLGRVYARTGKFDKAIEVWEEKLPLSKTPLERTWLCHEIGRCHLEQGRYEKAKEFGEKSLAAAQEAEDDVWQLNASVLIAQSEVKLKDYQAALDSFERSLEMAKVQDDKAAQTAIKKAIEDVNQKIVQSVKDEKAAENKKESDAEEKSEKEEVKEEKKEEPKKEEPKKDEPPKDVKYEIEVYTGDVKGAGTNANVHIVIKGTKGDTGKHKLHESLNKDLGDKIDKFEQDQKDIFEITAPDVGQVKSILIGHDASGFGDGWFLDKVVIKRDIDDDNEKILEFGCDQWLDEGEGDKKIERELQVGSVKVKAVQDYIVEVYTGDESGAGTNANVHLIITGDRNVSDRIELEDAENNSNKFEGGNMDRFKYELKNLGVLKKIVIGHDASGFGDGWFLDKVIVKEDESDGKSYTFPCGRWLDEGEDDKKIERELEVQK